YELTLRPWFWLAGRRRNQRIYHEKTVVQILDELLAPYAGLGKPAVEKRLSNSYPTLEYTVQYRESDLAFATRLMERFGISYHFEHADGNHALIMTDVMTAHDPLPGASRKFQIIAEGHRANEEHFWEMRPTRRMTTGGIRLTDYNFKMPNAAMEVDRMGDAQYAEGQIESYDYPGDYLEAGRGKDVARLRTLQERGQDHRHRAVGDCTSMRAGLTVKVAGDKVKGVADPCLCLSASHAYSTAAYASGQGGDGPNYEGSYVLLPVSAPLAPERKTHIPKVQGPQTAVVVGEGEIDCDEYGRILVHFHWDLDKRYSMRCRVSQNWAGKGWGGMVIPRIGMEVVVEFLEGDPDKPLVTGCVYNGKNDVPYDLPANKTRSVFRTDTHQGSGFNELTFEDANGDERIYVHAQKDHEVHVQNNSAKRVDVSEVESIGNSKYSEIGKDFNFQVGGNAVTAIGVSDVSLQASKPMQAYDDGPLQLAYKTTIPGGPDAGRGHYKMMVSQSMTTLIGSQSSTRIGDSSTVAVGTSMQLNVGAQKNETVGDGSYETVGGGRYMHVGKEIDLRCGASRFIMKRSGEIELIGTHIKLRAKKIDLN
ncbi:type VI secretion system tip protein TssI/VgrG, partial [Yoonia sp.]